MPALIFEPIKLRQERALRSIVQGGEKRRQSLGKYWNRRSHQNLIKLVWCLGGSALVTGGIQSAKQNEPGVWVCVFFFSFALRLPQSSTLVLQAPSPHSETDTDWENICTLFIITQQIPHAICWKQSRPYSLLLAQIIVSHFRLQLPWWHKCTFMRREISNDLMSFTSKAFIYLFIFFSSSDFIYTQDKILQTKENKHRHNREEG